MGFMTVCIFSTVNQIDAGIVKSALDEEDIDNYLKNYYSNTLGFAGWTTPFAGANLAFGDIEVYVKEEDAEKALGIVKALFGDSEDNQANEDISSDPGESVNAAEPPKVDPNYKFESVVGSSTKNTGTEEKGENNKYCYKCGKELKSGASFCSYCGAKQDEGETSFSSSSVKKEEFVDTTIDTTPRKRAPFTTIWLLFSLLSGFYAGYKFLFPDPMYLFKIFTLWYIVFILGFSILGIIGVILLLNWKKIGFWIYASARI